DKMEMLKDELLQLCRRFRTGIRFKKLPKIYKKQFGKDLEAADYEFPTIQALVESMNDILYLTPTKYGFTVSAISRKPRKQSPLIPDTSFGFSKAPPATWRDTDIRCQPEVTPSMSQARPPKPSPSGNKI
ncbi:hypothetical protein scyTo_0024233, partial [Scyliorhinus torazame]|nr:hypothetical protein [Scyliorhinus torazame]